MPTQSILLKSQVLQRDIEISLTLDKEALEALFTASEHLNQLNITPKRYHAVAHEIDEREKGLVDLIEIDGCEEEYEVCCELSPVRAADTGLEIDVEVGNFISVWTPDLQDTIGEQLHATHGKVTFSYPYPRK